MKRFFSFSKRYVTRYIWWYLTGFVLVAVTQAMTVAIIETIKNGIDAYGSTGPTSAAVQDAFQLIALLALGLILIRIASRLLVFTPGRMIEFHVRNDYFHRLLFLTRSFFRNHETGDLVSRCSNDIGFVRAAYGFAFLQVANVGTAFAFGLGAMLNMDVAMTVYLAIPMLIAFAIIQGSIQYMFGYWRLANTQLGDLSSLCLASYKGISAIQSYCAEPAFERAFLATNGAYLNTNLTLTKVRSFIMPLVQVVGNLAAFLVLWVAGQKVIASEMTLGEVTAFLGYISMVMPPLLSLGWMLNVFNRAVPAMERLDEILLATPDLAPVTQKLAKPGDETLDIKVKSMFMQYEEALEPHEKAFSLSDIDFDLYAGKTLGILGPVGAGKSTLLETLLRLNEPNPDQIYLQGSDATACDLDSYQSYFSFAPQKAFLFSTSLRENLAVSVPVAERRKPKFDEKIMHYLDLCGFDLDPDVFPHGLDTEVGEKGIMLSGGQRQRISLARALLKDAQVYVLDDVLSAVDHETERRIIRNLKVFAKDRAVVIVSHRISAIQWTDEILVIENGTISDRGPHDSLMNNAGYYRQIAHAQGDAHE